MSEYLPASLFLLLIAAAGLFYYFRKRKRGKIISELINGTDRLAHWTYTPVEWRRAVEEEFSWASNEDYMGEVFISPAAVYVRTNRRDHLIQLADKGKVVTHVSYRGAVESPLKIRVRWKVVTQHPNRGRETRYYKEDYRIPVPLAAKDAATKVVDYFNRQMESHPDAYADVVGDDEPISLFGRDSF